MSPPASAISKAVITGVKQLADDLHRHLLRTPCTAQGDAPSAVAEHTVQIGIRGNICVINNVLRQLYTIHEGLQRVAGEFYTKKGKLGIQ